MIVSELMEKLKEMPQDISCGIYDDVKIIPTTGVEVIDNDADNGKIKDKKIVVIY